MELKDYRPLAGGEKRATRSKFIFFSKYLNGAVASGTDSCVEYEVTLSNNYSVPDPDHLPCCVDCGGE